MAYSKASMKAVDNYVRNNYDRLNIKIPKGLKQAVEAHAQSKGSSINGLVNDLLRADMGYSEGAWKKGSAEDNGE